MHVQDAVQGNEETRDPSTTHGRAITSFLVTRRRSVNFWETTKSKPLSLSDQSLLFEVSPWPVWVEVKRELKFLRERERGVTESKQRLGTKVYWIVPNQSGKRKMNTLRHMRSSLALKCWTVLQILPIYPQGLERKVGIYPIVAG